MQTARPFLVASVVLAFALALRAQSVSQPAIPFKVAAKAGAALALLVAPNPTDEQLTALLNAFRAARSKGTLAQLIPPTTPNAKVGGPYNVVDVFVIADVYPASEPPIPGITGQTIVDAIARQTAQPHVHFQPKREQIPCDLGRLLEPGDLVIRPGVESLRCAA